MPNKKHGSTTDYEFSCFLLRSSYTEHWIPDFTFQLCQLCLFGLALLFSSFARDSGSHISDLTKFSLSLHLVEPLQLLSQPQPPPLPLAWKNLAQQSHHATTKDKSNVSKYVGTQTQQVHVWGCNLTPQQRLSLLLFFVLEVGLHNLAGFTTTVGSGFDQCLHFFIWCQHNRIVNPACLNQTIQYTISDIRTSLQQQQQAIPSDSKEYKSLNTTHHTPESYNQI